MASNCRHVMPSGGECHGYALNGGPFCYFHTRLHQAAKKPPGVDDSIEIPFLEDRCAIQVAITQILRAIVNNTIDRPRASLLLYGVQLALQNVDRNNWAIPCGTIEAITQTSDGDELAADPDDEDEDEDEEEEEDSNSDESGDNSGGEDDENSDHDSEEENAEEDEADDDDSDGEDDEDSDDDDDDDDDDDSEDDGLETTEDFIAAVKYLNSIKRQAGLDPDY
jgi:hypothetical protein